MKIACISTSKIPASTANSIQMMKVCDALARALSRTGGDLRVFVPRTPDTPAAPLDWATLAAHYGISTAFKIDHLPARPVLRRYDFAWSAVGKARAWGADFIYTWTIPAAALAARHGIPVILELHDRVTGRLGKWLFRQFLHSDTPKRLLVITEALRARLQAAFGPEFSNADVRIAPNGVNLEVYAGLPDGPSARRALGLAEHPTVVYTGHFYAGRGMELLYSLAQAFPQAKFLWVGGRTEDVAIWRERLKAGGLDNVVMTGFVENQRLPLYQAAGDILIMPYERTIAGSSGGNSADICSPMKMFDYLAASRAILSSDLPVIREILTETNAAFCPPEDLQAWCATLADLLADPQRCWALGQQARADAERYTWISRAEHAIRSFV